MTHIRSALVSLIAMAAPVALAPAAFAQSQPGFSSQDPMIARLQSRADSAEESARRLTGQIERMGFQNTQLRKQIEAQNDTITSLETRLSALDNRINRLESLANAPVEAASKAAATPGEATISLVGPTEPMTHEAKAARRDAEEAAGDGLVSKSSAPVQLAQTPEALFLQAKGLMTRGDYPAAEAAFVAYLEQYRTESDAPDAQYWLGEVLFIQEAYAEALESYVMLASEWPEARRAPDAWYKLARTLGKLGDTEEACGALDEMARLYPKVDPLTRSGAAQERENLQCPARKGG